MSIPPLASFGALLRRYRLAAGLSQEELAERAHLSREAIGALERGTRRAPRKETIELLAEALSLAEPERAAFEVAARQHKPTGPLVSTSPAPAGLEDASLEPLPPPQAGPPHPADPLTPVQPIQVPPPVRTRRKLVAGLVSGLLVMSLLGGVVFFKEVLTGAPHRTLCLATELSLPGLRPGSGPMENAARLAVMQNQDLGNGYTLKLISPQVILTDPGSGAHYVQKLVQDPCIVGVIGPYFSAMAAAEMPIAANAGLVMMSPSTTNPGLTLRDYARVFGWDFDKLHPPGKKTTFFRIIPNDVRLGTVAADFTFDDLAARGVYIVDDYTSSGKWVEGGFTEEFLSHGGAIVGSATIPFGGFAHLSELALSILAARPDAIFYGGTIEGGGGQLLAQLDQDGYTGFLVARDSIVGSSTFIAQVGARPDKTIFSIQAGRDSSTFTSGAAANFLHDYVAAYPGQPVDGSSANAYDAAMVLITAIKQIIRESRDVTRDTLVDQVQNITYSGVTGPISFDSNGDIAHGTFSIYTVQTGQWVYFQQARL